jgi:hypothetical protein
MGYSFRGVTNFDALSEGVFLLGLRLLKKSWKMSAHCAPKSFKARLEKNGSGTAGYRAKIMANKLRYQGRARNLWRLLKRAAEAKIALLIVCVKREPQHLVF